MFKFLIVAAAGFILYKLLTNDRKNKQEKTENKQGEQSATESGEMIKDPVCGTYVPVDCDIRVRKDGEVYHFCSYECRDEFLNELETKEPQNKELQK